MTTAAMHAAPPSAFERFARRHLTRRRHPRITLHRRGTLGLNRAAFEALDQPAALVFFYDRRARAIGLQPAAAGEPDAYRVVRKTTSDSYMVHPASFLRYFDIAPDGTVLWTHPRHEGDLLVLPLDEAVRLLRPDGSAR